MTQFSKLKQGEILSESQFYTVEKVVGDKVQLKPEGGESIVVDKNYAEGYLISGEQEDGTIEKITRTELAELLIKSPGVAMTVNYNKQVDPKDVAKEIMTAYENSTPKAVEDAVSKAVKKGLAGEERTMIGYHNGIQDEFGRVKFIDMKIATGIKNRLVDPRTLNYLILKGIKYKVK